MTFSVLFVCTGNLCRSPIAERLFRARIDPRAPVNAASAGTAGVAGHPIDGPSAVALRELGGDPDNHVARELTDAMIEAADLILTAETGHRSLIVQADPLSFRRVFTLREFGRLGGSLPHPAGPVGADALVARVAEIAGQRGNADPGEPGDDDIADPFGASLKVARGAAAEVAVAVDAVIDALGLAAVSAPQLAAPDGADTG